MKKCKDCGLFGCERRGDGETECFYDADLQASKELEEKAYWQSFRAEAAKDILCHLLNDKYSGDGDNKPFVSQAIGLTDELIKQLKEKEEK